MKMGMESDGAGRKGGYVILVSCCSFSFRARILSSIFISSVISLMTPTIARLFPFSSFIIDLDSETGNTVPSFLV